MRKLAHATGQPAANLAQRVGRAQVAKQHGDQLRPALKALRLAFGPVLAHQPIELKARKMLLKKLTEQMRGLYTRCEASCLGCVASFASQRNSATHPRRLQLSSALICVLDNNVFRSRAIRSVCTRKCSWFSPATWSANRASRNSREKQTGYAVGRECWTVDWLAVDTPLGLPGQRQTVCIRTFFVALREGLPAKAAQVRYYATSLPPHRADRGRLEELIRKHWSVENQLHHVEDRTFLEDRHWLGNRQSAYVLTFLRSLATSILHRLRLPGRKGKAHCPEKIQYLQASAMRAKPPRCARCNWSKDEQNEKQCRPIAA